MSLSTIFQLSVYRGGQFYFVEETCVTGENKKTCHKSLIYFIT